MGTLAVVEKITIDLSDPQMYSAISMLMMLWLIAVMLILYNIYSDVVAAIRAREPKQQPRPVRAPCAPELHEIVEGRCSICGVDEPQP